MPTFEGDTMMMNGDMEIEVKLMSTTTFTSNPSDPRENVDNYVFYPRVLIATSSCIRADLDSSSAHSVVKIGFPTILLDLIQKICRCGRNRINDGKNPTDNHYLFLSLREFMCLNERLHERNDDESLNNNARVIRYEAQRQLPRNNVLKALHMPCLNRTCWHQLLENEFRLPLELPSSQMTSCKGACIFLVR